MIRPPGDRISFVPDAAEIASATDGDSFAEQVLTGFYRGAPALDEEFRGAFALALLVLPHIPGALDDGQTTRINGRSLYAALIDAGWRPPPPQSSSDALIT